jgi:hypothetical protein
MVTMIRFVAHLPIGILGIGYRMVRCSRWLYFRLGIQDITFR